MAASTPASPIVLPTSSKGATKPSREVAETSYDLLAIEMVNLYSKQYDANEVLMYELEQLGIRIGEKIAEKCTADRNRFAEKIDIVKWLAKDLWGLIFNKPIDLLKTNHKGVFELTDNRFRWVARISGAPEVDVKPTAEKYVAFQTGIIKGALECLGVPCLVKGKLIQMPQCPPIT